MNVRNTPTDDPRYPDEETKKIVEAMKAEGKDVPVEEEPKAKEEPKQEPEPEAEPKDKEEPKADPEPKAKESEDLDDKPKRQVLIPIARVKQNEKKMRDEYEGKLSELNNELAKLREAKPNGADSASVDAKVEEITKLATDVATKHTADPELIKDILKSAADLNKKGVEVPPEFKEAIATIEAMKAEKDQQKETEKILTQYDDEFSKEFAGRSDEAKARAEEIRESGLTLKEFKEQLQDLVLGADGEKYAKLSLPEIYQLKKAELLPKRAKSADSSRGRTATGKSETVTEDLANLSPEEVAEMTDEEFEEYSNNLGKKSKSRVTRRGRPI